MIRDLHRLFLEQRHVIVASQDLHKGVAEAFDLFVPHTAVDEGMHHAALNRAKANYSDLADQIVEFAWAHPGQEVQLGPAFHLKHANRIGTAEHVLDRPILRRDFGQRQHFARDDLATATQLQCLQMIREQDLRDARHSAASDIRAM